ncbi:17013_t:CDS:2 [Cetraspora pellucida]|uniref:17013_t:CDS:1 n=1 Tax=Cetraspora pellucida TaxID=1433469 RepID=A0A9N8ZNW5_9GLOM|nr:17013_t:CDS:2 [Cetraspora pellucida]
MEFANNGDLYTYIQQKHHLLNWNKRLNLALQIANGLSVLHSEEIIHRDLHDKNILIHNDEAKIADLGHARNDNMETHVHSSLFGATPFLAPELLNNSNNFRNLPYCKQTDIYSLGFLFWELASGRRPFENILSSSSMNITSFCVKIINGTREDPVDGTPDDYENLYNRCWKTDPNEQR